MLIKVVLMLGIGAAALVLLRGYSGARHQAIRRLLLLAFTVLAGASLLAPQLWTAAAELLGVGRGTDLLLYLTIVAFLGYVATSYLRFRDLQRQITALSRRLALDEAPPPHFDRPHRPRRSSEPQDEGVAADARPAREPAAPRPRPMPRPAASDDPIFDRPYEPAPSATPPAWEKAAAAAVPAASPRALSPNIKPKKRVAALFGAKPARAEGDHGADARTESQTEAQH